jgi:hypothetical protein
MEKPSGWESSASRYLEVYQRALAVRASAR